MPTNVTSDPIQNAYYGMRRLMFATERNSQAPTLTVENAVSEIVRCLTASKPTASPWKAVVRNLQDGTQEAWSFDRDIKEFQAWTDDGKASQRGLVDLRSGKIEAFLMNSSPPAPAAPQLPVGWSRVLNPYYTFSNTSGPARGVVMVAGPRPYPYTYLVR